MQYDYDIARFLFLKAGFFVSTVFPTALLFLYPLARRRGRTWARGFILMCVLGFVGGGLATVAYAVLSGEWTLFVATRGAGSLFELFMLATLYFLAMWFMAVRTVPSLPETSDDAASRRPDA